MYRMKRTTFAEPKPLILKILKIPDNRLSVKILLVNDSVAYEQGEGAGVREAFDKDV